MRYTVIKVDEEVRDGRTNGFCASDGQKARNKKMIRKAWNKPEYGNKVRITRDDKVERYGQMPNTTQRGWYFAGYLSEYITGSRIIE